MKEYTEKEELLKRMESMKWKVARDTKEIELFGMKYANEMNNNLQDLTIRMPTVTKADIRAEAIDDFVKAIEKHQTRQDSYLDPPYVEMGLDMTDVLEVAKQLKEKGEYNDIARIKRYN